VVSGGLGLSLDVKSSTPRFIASLGIEKARRRLLKRRFLKQQEEFEQEQARYRLLTALFLLGYSLSIDEDAQMRSILYTRMQSQREEEEEGDIERER